MKNELARYTVKVHIDKCLMNKLDRQLNKEKDQVPKDSREQWEDENFMRKAYTGINGGIEIPSLNIQSMLVSGCKKCRVPPPKVVGRTWTSYFKSSILVESVTFAFKSVEPLGTMVNGNPSSNKKSSKVYVTRPLFKDCTMEFVLVDLDNLLTRDTVQDIATTTGLYIGFGDWRPLYGRYTLIGDVKEL